MSLVQQCLESLGGNYYNDYQLRSDEAAKYTMEDGAFLINMESTVALNDVFNAEFALEATMLEGVSYAKQYGIPVEEGLKELGSKIKEKVSGYWGKLKDWFKKMKEKVKAWFENLKRVFRSMFAKPADFVKRYKSDIESVSGAEVASTVQIYKYSNIDGYIKEMSGFQTLLTDRLLRTVETGIANASELDSTMDNKDNAEIALSVKDNVVKELEKKLGAADKRSEFLFKYFRSGATGADGKIVPSNLDMKKQVEYVLNMDKHVNEINSMAKTIDNTYNNIIKRVEQWQGKYSKDGSVGKQVTPILTQFTSTASVIQTTINAGTDACITAIKERAGVAYQICKKALSIKHKNDRQSSAA